MDNIAEPIVSGHWIINAPDIVTENFQGQAVILDLSNGHYYSLNGNAGRLWSLILTGYTFDAIQEAVWRDRPDLIPALRSFLAQVVTRKLVRRGDAGLSDSTGIAVPWSDDQPTLVVYDDLAELIYADPIHDVDEGQGWPVQRTAVD